MVFVGIDLAWKADHSASGGAVLEGGARGVRLRALAPPLRSLAAVEAFARAHVGAPPAPACVAVDAPLVIPNATGARACERALSRRYAARHAGCHPVNRTLYPDADAVRLAAGLAAQGFRHAPAVWCGRPMPAARAMLEVYTHAALVALFDLPERVRYKRGSAAERAGGLRALQGLIAALAAEPAPLVSSPALEELLGADPHRLRGAARKALEDALDAVVCAYVGYHAWRWGAGGYEVFGSAAEGYVVNPRLRGGAESSGPAGR